MESTIFEIIGGGGGGSAQPNTFVQEGLIAEIYFVSNILFQCILEHPHRVPARRPKVIQKAIFNNIQSESCDEVEIAA